MAATKKTTATTKTTATKTTKTTAAKSTTKTASKTCAKSTKTTAAKKTPVVKTEEVAVQGKRNILFVASEATPFIQTGGLAEVVGSLSTALAQTGKFDVRVILPLYSDIKKEYREKFTYLGNLYVHLAWRNQYCGVFSYVKDDVTYYFVDNEFYFKRPGCYGYFDDGERFAFFSRAVLEIIPFVNFYPEVMHCHDWQAALAAIYLKTNYCFRPEYQFIRCLFTIHNIEY
ncbi:MAG: glycogen synthase, partial [Candidatus Coproplasma sp.]